MFEYLKPADRPVIDGLEKYEVVYAKDQPEYLPLRSLRSQYPDGAVLSRWALTAEQRKAVAAGADIFLELTTFNQPLQPILLAVSDAPNATYFAHRFKLPTPDQQPTIPVQFICNGSEHLVTCHPDATLALIVDELVKAGYLGGDPFKYEIRNRDGVLLENAQTIGWFKGAHFCEGFEPGQEGTPDVWRVFVSLPVGIGG